MFAHEESAKKLIYLALQRIMEKWKLPVRAWSEAVPVFAAMYGERFAALPCRRRTLNHRITTDRKIGA